MHFAAVFGTVLVFIFALWLNQEIFTHLEFVRGVNWIYLPAGVRLLSTLLLGGDGAMGLLLASWIVDFFYFFPHDPPRALIGGIVATIAPYAVYRIACLRYGLDASLQNLNARRLLILVAANAIASPLLHHIWFALEGDTDHLFERFIAMVTGDLCGNLIVIYSMKAVLSLFDMFARQHGRL